MRPKLILTDLDGTLLDDAKHVTSANRAALERAAAQGAEIVVATGRFLAGVPQELRELPFLRYFILMNGAKVYDRKEDKILYRREIPLATAERIFDWLGHVDATVDCYQNDVGLMDRRYYDRLEYYIHDIPSRELVYRSRVVPKDFRAAVRAGGDSVQKIQCYFPDLRLRQEVQQQLALEFPELVSSISMPENLEINNARATKGHAMLALCRALSINPQEAAAFGDGTNDLTMLQWAGTGVAMSNAAPEVRAAADVESGSNQENGVAQVLNQWFEA